VPLLTNVPVIATGMRTVANEGQAGDTQSPYRTVTISVAPEDAARITLAQDAGRITIALRQPEDTKDVQIARVSKFTLLNGAKRAPASAPRRRVEIILGGLQS
jgi:pilus assembly protein CpaB